MKLLIVLLTFTFSYPPISHSRTALAQDGNRIECSETGCEGAYIGPEFVNSSDVAHQFSNTMATKVGDALKALYDNSKYCRVDFSHITMSTKRHGFGKGNL